MRQVPRSFPRFGKKRAQRMVRLRSSQVAYPREGFVVWLSQCEQIVICIIPQNGHYKDRRYAIIRSFPYNTTSLDIYTDCSADIMLGEEARLACRG